MLSSEKRRDGPRIDHRLDNLMYAGTQWLAEKIETKVKVRHHHGFPLGVQSVFENVAPNAPVSFTFRQTLMLRHVDWSFEEGLVGI